MMARFATHGAQLRADLCPRLLQLLAQHPRLRRLERIEALGVDGGSVLHDSGGVERYSPLKLLSLDRCAPSKHIF